MQRAFATAASAVAAVALLGAASGAPAQAPSAAQVERGRYLARAADCAGCHTAQGGEPYAGGKPIPTPFGTIYAPNITPDRATGIGGWSADAFHRALHDGIDDEGAHLYPAFPYPWFTKLTRADVDAIGAYLKTVKAVRNPVPEPDLPWPLSWRGSVAAWNALYLDAGAYRPAPDRSAQWNRGAYLVEGAGHCGACHTPKNGVGAAERGNRLEGGDAGEHWYAPSLTGALRDGIGAWSVGEIVAYLKTGANRRTAAAGSMKEVVERSTQYLSDADLTAIAVYLKDLPGAPEAPPRQVRASRLDGAALARGEALYLDDCIGCHMADGNGIADVFPPLNGSAAIQAAKPDTVIHVVVAGQRTAQTAARPTGLAMPAFADKMTDQEIADVVSYIRNAWGNHASPVGADAVRAIRAVAQPIGGGTLNRPGAVRAPARR